MENENEIVVEEEITKKNPVEERMRNLSKAKLDAETAKTEAETKAQNAEKEVSFYKDFSGSISKYPAANEFQDAIKEKVMSGYTMEDATVAVLNREGKLQPQTAPIQRQSPAGGSASNALSGGAKSQTEMTRDERRQAIRDAEARGDISLS